MQTIQRNKKPLAVAAAAAGAYLYYRTRMRETVAMAPLKTVPIAAVAQSRTPDGAYVAQQQATQRNASSFVRSVGPEIENAWYELEGAVKDARRHGDYLEREFHHYKQQMATEPQRAEQELRDAIQDAQAHAAYVASQVQAFGRLAGYDVSSLLHERPAPHPYAGPPSTTQ